MAGNLLPRDKLYGEVVDKMPEKLSKPSAMWAEVASGYQLSCHTASVGSDNSNSYYQNLLSDRYNSL
jgi:hypothetical protein